MVRPSYLACPSHPAAAVLCIPYLFSRNPLSAAASEDAGASHLRRGHDTAEDYATTSGTAVICFSCAEAAPDPAHRYLRIHNPVVEAILAGIRRVQVEEETDSVDKTARVSCHSGPRAG